MVPNLAALAKRVATECIDTELGEIWLNAERTSLDSILDAPRPLVILAICNLVFTKRVYSLESVLAAVEANPNPKLAYCALVYYWRTAIDGASPSKLWVASKLLLLLDDTHLAKSPIPKLVLRLQFPPAHAQALRLKFPAVDWRSCPAPADLAAALKHDCMAVFTAPDKIKDLRPISNLHKALKAAALHKPFFQFVAPSNLRLAAACCSLYFNTPDFLTCPFSHQFTPAWSEYLKTLVPAIFKARAWTEFALAPHGTVIFLTFCLAVRPTELPLLELSGTDRVWLELCQLILFGTDKQGTRYLTENYGLLPPKGQLLALDVLIRNGGDLVKLGSQLVRLRETPGIDTEPLCILFLVNGHVSLYKELAELAGAACTAQPSKTAPDFIHSVYHSPLSGVLASISANARPSSIRLLEESLPTINSLSINSTQQMLKMELAFIVIAATVAKLYSHLGYETGARQMRKTGRAKATGLWATYFDSTEESSREPDLDEFVAHLCQVPTAESPAPGVEALRRHVRRTALFAAVEDSALSQNLCGIPPRRKRQPTALAQTALNQWSFLDLNINHLLKTEWSRLVLESAPAMAVLSVPCEPQLDRAAENLRCPALEALSTPENSTLNPHDNIVVTINMCKRSLLLTRHSSQSSITVRLPLDQHNDSCNEFRRLVQQSIHLSCADSSSDRWWRAQARLGDQLRACIQNMDAMLFGSFGGLLSPWCFQGTEHLDSARRHLVQLYKRFLPAGCVRALEQLHSQVVELFLLPAKMRAADMFNPADFQSEFISQLNYFVLDAMRLRGYDIDYDLIDVIELESTLLSFAWSTRLPLVAQKHVVLIPDEALADLPWECFPSIPAESVSRCLSCWHYKVLCNSRKHTDGEAEEVTDDDEAGGPVSSGRPGVFQSVYYVLNPNSNLKNATEMFSQTFKLRSWQGVVEAAPTEKELVGKMLQSTCYIYIGHGSGHKFVRSSTIRQLSQCSAVMLFGCSSAKLVNGQGPLVDYALASCPLFMGFMWDVPNMDCNRFTQEYLRLCFDERLDVFKALQLARKICKIYTTQLAPVIYGLP